MLLCLESRMVDKASSNCGTLIGLALRQFTFSAEADSAGAPLMARTTAGWNEQGTNAGEEAYTPVGSRA
jgi:hypothetical protein